jgi:translation initiation factor IF-2
LAKNLKLNIKNTQIAEAIKLGGLKSKLAKKPTEETEVVKKADSPQLGKSEGIAKEIKEEAPRIRARSRSAFSEPQNVEQPRADSIAPLPPKDDPITTVETETPEQPDAPNNTSLKSSEGTQENKETKEELASTSHAIPSIAIETTPIRSMEKPVEKKESRPTIPAKPQVAAPAPQPVKASPPPYEKLGPTGRHVKDLFRPVQSTTPPPSAKTQPGTRESTAAKLETPSSKPKGAAGPEKEGTTAEDEAKKLAKPSKFKEFRDVKPAKRHDQDRGFDSRDRQGLRSSEEDQRWRKKRQNKIRVQEDLTIRPSSLKVRIPISIKDLAVEMKLKASELIAKLFLQGVIMTLNDTLEDETMIQLLGNDFGCDIIIDTVEEKRIQITDKTVKQEIKETQEDLLIARPPVVAFMGHVDHGKTSLIDSIRQSNRAAGEAGAITQHIGAFRCQTKVGDITILDTPGHEAFSAMRARGADVTDIVVLVVAGDEGLRQQSLEAIQHARAANVTIVVAINKCDKPNFNQENVYRQLADIELLPESWGGQTITVNCSATTGEGIQKLLEMLALQAEVLELKANPSTRARGRVLESELHKGLGAVTTILVQNGNLKKGDSLVFDQYWGKVKTMRDDYSHELPEAGPSTPVEITGLSGLPEAGQEFIVVKSEKEARDIASVRQQGQRQTNQQLIQKKKVSVENLLQQASETGKKTLNLILRADVQGSLEALKSVLQKIESQKADVNIIFAGIGEISESDVQLAAASKAVIIGFHTKVESHAESLIKQLAIECRLHDIIYHVVDDVKLLMGGLLEKIALEVERGKAQVKATFKSSQLGIIAGCIVTEGAVARKHQVRLKRNNEVIWKGSISSLKRVKEDVREVLKGLECGIVLQNFTDFKEDDVIETYETSYISQEL